MAKASQLKPPGKITDVAKPFVPHDAVDIVGMDMEKDAVRITMEEGIPLIMVGHTGVAKTALLKRMHQDAGWPYRSITGHGRVEVETLVGKWVATPDKGMEYKLGILPFCMKHGVAVGMQEINVVLPEVLVLLHEYVDEGFITLMDLDPDHPDFIIRPHENFRLYGTMNPPELYAGTRELSPALVRRCIIKQVGALTEAQEVEVITAQCPWVDKDVAAQMASVAQSVRQQFEVNAGLFWLSTADLVTWGRLLNHLEPFEAGLIAVVGKAPANEQDFVEGRIRLAFDPNAGNTTV